MSSNVNMAKLYRLKKWKEEKQLTGDEYAFSLIKKFCENYHLDNDLNDYIFNLYKKVKSEELLRGRSVEIGVACCCFIGCRCKKLAYNVNDVINVIHVGKKEVNSMYRSVKRGLGLNIPLLSVKDYIDRYSSELKLSDDVYDCALEYVSVGEKKGLVNGKNPLGLVAGCLYCACKEHDLGVTQKEIVDIVGVSEVVLRKRVRELKE